MTYPSRGLRRLSRIHLRHLQFFPVSRNLAADAIGVRAGLPKQLNRLNLARAVSTGPYAAQTAFEIGRLQPSVTPRKIRDASMRVHSDLARFFLGYLGALFTGF